MLKAYIIHIHQDLQQNEYNQLLSLITEEKLNRIEKYHFYLDAQRSLLGDVLARWSICKHYHLRNADLHFHTNKYDKPFVMNRSDIQYNVSHSGRYVTCVVSDGTSVGIDLEEIKPIDMNIMERFFTKDEYDYVVKQPVELKLEAFYHIWTRKESYIKMIGKGLSVPLDSFCVLKKASTNPIYYHQLIKNQEVIGNICTKESKSASCELIDCRELLSWAQTQLN